jgi:hypothetical protein
LVTIFLGVLTHAGTVVQTVNEPGLTVWICTPV